MRFIFIFAISLLSLGLFGQSKSVKKWSSAEKKFLYYSNKQDYEKAALYNTQMKTIAYKKFKSEDSLYAATVLFDATLAGLQNHYLQQKELLAAHLPWLRSAFQKGTRLNFRHYSYLLEYGNACYNLGESYMSGRRLVGTDQQLPSDQRERYQMALSYFDTAIAAYQELKKIFPTETVAANLAVVYNQKGLLQGQFLGDLEGCIQSLTEAVSYQENVETYRLLGVANGIAGRHFIAIEHFEKALALGGEQVAILYNLEVAYRQLVALNEGKEEADRYLLKAETYQLRWKAIDPNYGPKSGN